MYEFPQQKAQSASITFIKTTELYARANLEMKLAAIEKVSPAPTPNISSWKENKSLLQWLQQL